MKLTIPVYVHQERKNDGMFFTVRPLFAEEPVAQGEHLNRVLTRLTGRLTSVLSDLVRDRDHSKLLPYSFSPTFADRTVDVPIRLRDHTVNLKVLLVIFEALDRTVAFSPQVPEAWFTVEGDQTLRERAGDVFSQHFRDVAKKRGDEKVLNPERDGLLGKAWVTSVDVDLTAKQKRAKKAEPFAFLGPNKAPEGQSELSQVGRCLDWLFPDELERALFREEEIAELARLLDDPQCRPVLVLGPPGVGKTALIHEVLFRRIQSRGKQSNSRGNTWLLSPQRLISGMSFVGQWENRVLAILEAARERKHTLYFDDLIGLFHSGQTSQSQLSIAHVLKPVMERRDVRVLAEITPEAFRVLQELDRGFADLFQVLRLREPTAEQTLRILIRVQQQLEGKHEARFDLDCLPAVLDVQRRYCRDISFPGKGAAFLSQLAVKFAKGNVTRDGVLREFQRKSGLALNLLDTKQKLPREEIVTKISEKIIGQRPAIEAFADAISISKARLNDTGKPLGVFLFLGPTGVGKTQCAKALAEYLFGSADRLLRFDLNEFISDDAVTRLAGTVWQPEGLLTSAVRRQPFSIVLLDEIEKAHPAVSDLLLQVLGEGRLSDGRGRTVDFTNTIVIMTSNLGVQEAHSTLGLKYEDRAPDPSVYVRAAERFFRPEFFNRIDRILPFARLSRDEIRSIAKLLIADVFRREGLTRRKCILQIHPDAMEKVVDEGYHPELGARALMRALERQLTRPAAEYLASISPETPAVISLYPRGEGIAVDVQALEHAPPLAEAQSQRSVLSRLAPDQILERCRLALKRFEKEIATRRPPGEIDTTPQYQHYFALRDAFTRLKAALDKLDEQLDAPKSRMVRRSAVRPRTGRILGQIAGDGLRSNWAAMFAAQDVHAFVRDFLSDDAPDARNIGELASRCVQYSSFIDALLRSPGHQRVVLVFRPINEISPARLQHVFPLLRDAFGSIGGLDTVYLEGLPAGLFGFVVEGHGAGELAHGEQGTVMIHLKAHGLVPIQILALALVEGQDAVSAVSDAAQARDAWLKNLAAGNAAPDADPFRIQPVLRIFDERQNCIDLRTQSVTNEAANALDLRHFICGTLPPSTELLEA